MKKYNYKFSKGLLALFIAVGVIAIVTIAWNIWGLIKAVNESMQIEFYGGFSYAIIMLISLFAIVVVVSALIKSYYQITDKEVLLRWGIIKNPIKLTDITKITYITNKNRLELSLKDDTYFAIVIKESWVDEFITELKGKIPKIPYEQITEEENKK